MESYYFFQLVEPISANGWCRNLSTPAEDKAPADTQIALQLDCPAVQQFRNLHKYNKLYFNMKYILSSTYKDDSLLRSLDSRVSLCPHLVIASPTDSYSSIKMILVIFIMQHRQY